jgi:hypothetical protein
MTELARLRRTYELDALVTPQARDWVGWRRAQDRQQEEKGELGGYWSAWSTVTAVTRVPVELSLV